MTFILDLTLGDVLKTLGEEHDGARLHNEPCKWHYYEIQMGLTPTYVAFVSSSECDYPMATDEGR